MKKLSAALFALIVLTLSACGQAPTDPDPDPPAPEPETATATANPPADVAPFVGAALLLVDHEVALAPVPAAVIEGAPGIYVGTVSPVGADGAVELLLPAADEVPTAALAPAEEFFSGLDYATCELTTSAAGVSVSEMSVGTAEIPLPGVLLFNVDEVLLGIATPEPLDLYDPATELVEAVTWLYADAAVTIATPAAGCTAGGIDHQADLALTEGWNQVAVEAELDAVTGDVTAFNVTNANYENVYLNPVPPL